MKSQAELFIESLIQLSASEVRIKLQETPRELRKEVFNAAISAYQAVQSNNYTRCLGRDRIPAPNKKSHELQKYQTLIKQLINCLPQYLALKNSDGKTPMELAGQYCNTLFGKTILRYDQAYQKALFPCLGFFDQHSKFAELPLEINKIVSELTYEIAMKEENQTETIKDVAPEDSPFANP